LVGNPDNEDIKCQDVSATTLAIAIFIFHSLLADFDHAREIGCPSAGDRIVYNPERVGDSQTFGMAVACSDVRHGIRGAHASMASMPAMDTIHATTSYA
jgi:hypothetical protein